MKKVLTQVEFVWDKDKQEYIKTSEQFYYSNESFALCDSGDSGSSGGGGDQTNSENSFDDGSMANSMGQNNDGSWGGDQTNSENSFDDGSMANSMGQNLDGSWNGVGGGWTQADIDAAFNAAKDATYDENSVGNSGRGGNVGGVTGPSGGLGVGGFGSQAGFDQAVSDYESDPSGWNSNNNNFAGLDGPVDADTFANWASRNGFLSQVGAGQKGAFDDARDFVNDNPFATNLISLGLYAVNPVLGTLNSLFTSALNGRGGAAVGSTLGGLFAGPAGKAAGGFLGGLVDGKSVNSALGSLANQGLGYGLNAAGLNFGQNLNSALSNDRGSFASWATGQLGNYAQAAFTGAVGSAVTGALNNASKGDYSQGPAGTSSLATGISNTGSDISSNGFNLFGGLDNNGGTGSFDLNKGIVSGGLSALGQFLLSGNNNMATGINLGDLGSFGASLYGQYGDRYSDNLRGISGAADPTLYNTLLAQSYTDPKSVYDRDYSALDKTFYGDLMARASAEGRTTDNYKMGLAREAQFQNFLNNYRAGLSNTAQGRLNTYTGLQTKAAQNTQDLKNTTTNALSKLFGSNTVGGKAVDSGLSSLGNLFSSGLSSAGNYLGDLWNQYTGDSDSYLNEAINGDIGGYVPEGDTNGFTGVSDDSGNYTPSSWNEFLNEWE